MDDYAIRVEHVSKRFVLPHEKITTLKGAFTSLLKHRQRTSEVQHALEDITFSVKKGEFFGIVGRNGSGKSTMLKILANIYQPTRGKVITSGKLVPFIELGVGFNPELTGRENVYLNGAMLGFARNEIDSMYEDIVSFAELNDFMDQKLKNYSSGMQVRLAFACATRAEADILLVDEVLAVGDASFQRKCYDYFSDLKKKGRTVVFVTHDMNAVREYCDRAILIEKSKIVAEGNANTVASKYTRLFNSPKDVSKNQQTSANRWGNNEIVFSDVKLGEKKIEKDDTLRINLRAIAKTTISHPIAGFSIRNSSGIRVSGTNTLLERQNVGKLEEGEILELDWEVANIFPDGKYSVDLAIVKADGATVCDWWEDALSFVSVREQHTPFLAYAAAKVSQKITRG